jgi:tRNA(fMet)-specific endonuclease VapC
MPGYLLDTNVISEAIQRVPNPHILGRIRENMNAISLAAPTWHEIWFGVTRLTEPRRRSELRRFFLNLLAAGIPVLPYDSAAAQWHAEERSRLERLGRVTPYADGHIAAVAAINDLTLVTRNVKDFNDFLDLRIEDWHQPS